MVAQVKAPIREKDEPDFVESLGPAFLAHLLRRLSDELVDAGKRWHVERGVANRPRTSSTLLALERHGTLAVTELAAVLRQSHQLVKQWIKELRRLKLVAVRSDTADARRSLVSLTDAGRAELGKLKREIAIIERATQALVDEAAPGLIESLWALELDLRERPFVDRIRRASERRSPPARVSRRP